MNEYMTNIWIDGIQNAKKTWVDTWVKDEEMSKPLYDFIQVQREFTKDAMKHTDTFSNTIGEAIARAVK